MNQKENNKNTIKPPLQLMERSTDNESIDYNLSAESEIISIKNTKTFMRLATRQAKRRGKALKEKGI